MNELSMYPKIHYSDVNQDYAVLTEDIFFPANAVKVSPVYGDVRIGRVFVVFDTIRLVEWQELGIPIDHEGDVQTMTNGERLKALMPRNTG